MSGKAAGVRSGQGLVGARALQAPACMRQVRCRGQMVAAAGHTCKHASARAGRQRVASALACMQLATHGGCVGGWEASRQVTHQAPPLPAQHSQSRQMLSKGGTAPSLRYAAGHCRYIQLAARGQGAKGKQARGRGGSRHQERGTRHAAASCRRHAAPGRARLACPLAAAFDLQAGQLPPGEASRQCACQLRVA